MNTDELLFGTLPYVAVALAIVVTTIRWRRHPFSVSSLSSQLLESRKLYWGSVPFHWGISLILVGHLVALVIPRSIQLWNGDPLRLYALEATGLALAFWAAFGIFVLIYRRVTDAKVQTVTTKMDIVVLTVVATQILTGIWVAIGHRWGSYWGTSTLSPYIWSLASFQPEIGFVSPMPLAVKIHIVCFFIFVAIFPFSRLVHIITLPLQYLFRPWQKVVGNRYMSDLRPQRSR